MPHPLLIGALASVMSASEPGAAVLHLQDGARVSVPASALADSIVRAAQAPNGATPVPAGTPGVGSTTLTTAAAAPAPAPASAGSGSVAASASGEGAYAAPAASAPTTVRGTMPASAAAAARLLRPSTGTAASPRLALSRSTTAPSASVAAVLPALVGDRARYRSADPYVATTAASSVADSMVVEKGARRLTLFRQGGVVRVFAIALGGQPAGHKVQRGDKRTPEGLYYIEARNPHSRYHLALRVSYPNTYDLWRARALGVAPGGDIMIHGLPNGQGYVGEQHRLDDWTEGCIAVTNQEIEELWRSVPVGTPIEIKP